MAPKQESKNARTALVMAIVIVIIAVASWFYLAHFSGRSNQPYKNVTFTDALIKCREFTELRYGSRLLRLTIDDHSSRWEQKAGEYKIFFKAEMRRGEDPSDARDYWVSCDVGGRQGSVRDYDILEIREQKNEAIRKNDGGMFGWP